MLPQELKEMPQFQQIIILENTKPILCEKALYFQDVRFVDRLKAVSACLAGLDRTMLQERRQLRWFGVRKHSKVMPTEAQLKHAAFVLEELSAPVPVLNVQLHKAKVEQKTRSLDEGEAIDLEKLAIDVHALPLFDDSDAPSRESAMNIVNAFFAQIGAAEMPGDTHIDFAYAEAPALGIRVPSPHAHDASSTSHPSSPAGSLNTIAGGDRGRSIDLSALDQ
jgi:type IV secretion system protein VirD4